MLKDSIKKFKSPRVEEMNIEAEILLFRRMAETHMASKDFNALEDSFPLLSLMHLLCEIDAALKGGDHA